MNKHEFGRSAVVKVNVGSGGDPVAGWINVDKSPARLLARWPRLRWILARFGLLTTQQQIGFSASVVYGDATRRLPFGDGTVDMIYSAHMIEHLSRQQGLAFLSEALRALKPGGKIRLATPDVAALAAGYCANRQADPSGVPAESFMEQLHFLHDSGEGLVKRFISRNLSGHWHQWLYDADSLSALCRQAGFHGVSVATFRAGQFPDLDRIEFRPESLFIQAHAPDL